MQSIPHNYTTSFNKCRHLLLLLVLFMVVSARGQNLNNPNKRGPLGTQVNTLSGNLFIPRTDIFIPARGFNLNISFHYNSFLFTEDYGYGKGWTFEYSIKYSHDTIPGARLILWGDGREDKYDSLPGGGYRSPKGFFNTLSQYQPGKYVLTELDGVKYFFDNAVHKKVTRMEEPNGNFINFTYTDSLLSAMTNAAGQSITFTYNPQGRLATVLDAVAVPSRTFTYTYDAIGNLKEVKDPLNGKYQYTYLVNGPMKSLADKNNNKVDIVYFSDMTIRELVGCNKRLSFSYDTSSSMTVVTDHVATGNQVTKYTYKTVDKVSWVTSMSGNCCGFNIKYEYDNQGNQIMMTDANGQVYTFTYDEFGNMLTATNPLGHVSTYTYTTDFKKISSYKDPKGNLYTISYDGNGNMTQLVTPGNNIYTAIYNTTGDIITSADPKGNSYSYNYDAYGNPTNVTGPNGYNAVLSFDARGRLLSYTDARGNSSLAEYDILDRLKKITDPINNNVQFSYDAEGNAISVVNKNNEVSSLSYDASNRLVKATSPTGNQYSFTYDGMDNLLSVKNPLGHEIKMNYDNRNRLKGTKDPENNNAVYNYDGNGNITSINLPNGRSINYTYDQLNRITSVNDATSTIATFAYDNNGNITSVTNATGAITTAFYDSLDRIKQIIDPLGNSSSYVYDKNNNVISVTDREGRTSHYTYDSIDRVKTYTDKNSFVLTVGYDVQGNITSLKDQNNNITIYTYDSLNRRKRMTYPDGKYMEYNYDKKSNVTSILRTDASIVTFQYDTLNRVISRTLPGGEVYGYTYDKLNRVLTATNNNGTVSFTYDVLNRVTSESFDGRTINYNYSIAGRTQTTIYPDSTVVKKEFDIRNRLTKILKNNITVAEYAYNIADQLTNKTFANGIHTTMQYDFANRLNSITTGTIQNTTFTYDKMMNKTAINQLNNPSLSEQFTYDNGYRLTNYKRGPVGSPVIQNTYTYDAVGNRTAANLNGAATTYSINNLNQLIGVNSANFTFDDRGNITYDGTFFKTYDAENRLVKDSSSPASVIAYGYDAMNRRVTKSINGNTLKYTYSGAAQIEERDGSNNLLNRIVFSNFLSPVMNEKSGNQFYYHPNELGSVEAISNSNGRLIESYRYDVYGKLSRFDSLNNPLATSITGNRFGFTGQEYDSASGSYRFFFRNYSPETGVFHQRDLIEYGDGMGMYLYAGNNPANGVDVWGLQVLGCEIPDKEKTDTWKLEDHEYKWREPYAEQIFLENLNNTYEGAKDLYMTTTDGISDAKNIYEPFGHGIGKNIPGPTDLVLTVVGLPNSIAKTNNSVKEFMDPTNSFSENLMYGGDIIKNGAIQLTDEIAIGGAVTGQIEVTAISKGVGYGIWGVDKFAYSVGGEITGADAAHYDRMLTDELKSNYIRNNSERAERWDDYFRKQEEAEKRNSCVILNSNGTRRKFVVKWDDEQKMFVVKAQDPNLIIGPDGQPGKKWVSVNDRLPYTILFENDSNATARARYIKITSPVEPKQDPATLELGSFGFNNQSFDIPSGLAFYTQRLDARDSTGVYVDLTAGYDVINNQVFWEFQAIDPLTLLPPEDPLAGFLFLRDSTQEDYGKGFVNFSFKPRSDALTLDTIGARGFIVFDENEVIPTNIHTNTIDALPPLSVMNSSVETIAPGTVRISWNGHDDPGGCGIASYSLYVSMNNGSYTLYRADIADTSLIFPVISDSTYCFYVTAKDSVKNQEPLKNQCELSVLQTGITPSVSIVANPDDMICPGTNVTFTATPANAGAPSYQWKLNGNNVGTNSNTYQNNSLANGDVVLVEMTASTSPTPVTSNSITMEVIETVTPSVSIAAGPGNTICSGTNVTFTATPTNGGTPSYQWKLNGGNVGTNSNTYQNNSLVNGDVVTIEMTSSLGCASPNPVTSNSITMVVTSAVTPSVSISANPGNTICSGTSVTFTASPTNGGTPSYQWKLNGGNVGTNSNTYQNNSLANGDAITCQMASSLGCASPNPATSNSVTMVVTSTVIPSVSIAAGPGNTICSGTNVTFTATPTNGGTPSYQWKLNGSNVGTNSSTYQNNALANGDLVSVVMTSSLSCASPNTATSNSITMVVTSTIIPSVSVAASPGNTICSGTSVTFTATPTNGGTPSYQWKLNGGNVGTNSNTYQSNALANGDLVSVVMSSSLSCASPNPVTSNSITMVVTSAVTPLVSIAANPGNTICSGTSVTFTATPTNGGTPSYQWKLNGGNVGTNSNTYQNNSLANGDAITCQMTSSLGCASPNPVTSNSITMVVTSAVTPSVSIAANPGNTICSGTNVTFTATPTNGGTPSYQWKLNGSNVGTNSNTYQNNALANGDAITCQMTSSLGCASPNPVTSNSVTMVVTTTVTPSVSIAASPGNNIVSGTNVTFTATPTNGGTPSYQWKLNGGNVGTNSNTYQNNTLANGNIVSVVMTSSLGCASPSTATSNSITMTVTGQQVITISIGDVSVQENAGFAQVPVTLSGPSSTPITVKYKTANGTAKQPADYTQVSNVTLTFAPGQVSQTLNIPIINDGITEGNEYFFVSLNGPANATIADGEATVTIIDVSTTNSISIGDIMVLESAGFAQVPVTLSGPSSSPVTVKYKTINATAKHPRDFTQVSNATLTFAPGQTSQTINISIINDGIAESDEYFLISLSNPVNATIADGEATVTITETLFTRINNNSLVDEAGNEITIRVPNPQRKQDVFKIYASQPGKFDVVLMDLSGRKITEMKDYQNNWSLQRLATGFYFYRIIFKNSKGELFRYNGKLFVTE